MAQIVYKLRHKHTGLFLDTKGMYLSVSKWGKVYTHKPPKQTHINIPYEIRGEYDSQFHNAQTRLDDWEVVEFKLVPLL